MTRRTNRIQTARSRVSSDLQPSELPGSFIAALGATLGDDQLQKIASMDYGHDLRKNHAALRRIAKGDLGPLRALGWVPKEVLELFRWTPLSSGDGDERARHSARLFACLSLLAAVGLCRSTRSANSINGDLVLAADSVIDTLPEHRTELLRFLDWFENSLAEHDCDEKAFIPLARFLIRAADPAAPAEALVSDLVRAEAAATAERRSPGSIANQPQRKYGWVLDLTLFDHMHRLWRGRLDEALVRASAAADRADVAAQLTSLASRRA